MVDLRVQHTVEQSMIPGGSNERLIDIDTPVAQYLTFHEALLCGFTYALASTTDGKCSDSALFLAAECTKLVQNVINVWSK